MEIKERIAEILQSDSTLLGMLSINHPFWDDQRPEEAKWSIVTADQAPLDNKPFVTIQAGPESLLQVHLSDAFIYIRCYNGSDKTYVEISEVLERIRVILHRRRFTLTGKASIDTLFEATGAELRDQAYDLNFRESRYRILYL